MWAGVVAGRILGVWVGVVGLGLLTLAGMRGRRQGALVLAALLAAGTLAGGLSARREARVLDAEIPERTATVTGRMGDDPRPGRTGWWFPLRPIALEGARWEGPVLLVTAGETPPGRAGDVVRVEGALRSGGGRMRGLTFAGRMRARSVEGIEPAPSPLFAGANRLRARIEGGLEGRDHPAAGLVSGFLIGDVRGVSPEDMEAMRRSGLSHFVAVSGSNVALFLGLLWLATAPLATGAGRRALLGIPALALFVVLTRWEPSVLRAGAAAALVLAGRAAGVPLTGWTALGLAVSALLLVAPELAGEVGFQLSVAATAGVLAGSGLLGRGRFRRTRVLLGASLAAQAAVAPLLLYHFGSVPLGSPLANLLAAPLVTLATAAGGLGLLVGLVPLVELGVRSAAGVLAVAHLVAGWPQLGAIGVTMGLVVGAGWLRPRLRPLAAVAGAFALVGTVVLQPGPPSVPTVIFLDVGQGDATLLMGPGGETVLVDGGPDPIRILHLLERRGARRVDLAVLTHPHADHLAGLERVVRALPVGRLWHPPISNGELDALLAAARERGVAVEAPPVGRRVRVGSFSIEVLGPLRRYASLNDQSLVLMVEAVGSSVLLSGDVETVAQRELGPVPADVMKVPHQGAATSDPAWLAASAGRLAVISVGPNTYGHPAPEVIAILEAAGSEVRRTDLEGDVVVRLGADLATARPGGG